MLLEFTVGNFRSFKEKKTFSMVAAPITELENNTFKPNEKFKLLKSAAIYGANASGKSNLIEAIDFFRDFIMNSSKESQFSEDIDVENFSLNTETENEPSFFEMVFVYENIRYRYGFEVDKEKIHSEWLFSANMNNKIIRESRLFTREYNKIEINAKQFKEGRLVQEARLTRQNALFLSVNTQFNGLISSKVYSWIKHKCIIIFDSVSINFSKKKLSDVIFKKWIMNFIKVSDVSIEDLVMFDDEVESVHRKYNNNDELVDLVNFEFENDESVGTKKIFEISTPIIDALKNKRIIIVDELDNSMHPNLCKMIVEMFNSKETNPNGAQLIFTTHDVTLLKNDVFRRDQIWFTEKDRYGATDLFSLVEYKVRKDASFDKDYIIGKYGAIPFLGTPATIFGEENDSGSKK